MGYKWSFSKKNKKEYINNQANSKQRKEVQDDTSTIFPLSLPLLTLESLSLTLTLVFLTPKLGLL
jgi:hypothetical protein